MGYITKGLCPRNRITIRCRGPADIPIVFDSLSLHTDDTDTDGDGVSDIDEGIFSLDPNTVCIPIKSYHPADVKKICLYLEGRAGALPLFREVQFLDPNAIALPEIGRYFPYQPLGFTIEDLGAEECVDMTTGFEDPLFGSARFYTYRDSNVWEETGSVFLDGNSAVISLNDGGLGDSDGATDGYIHAILTLSYPMILDMQVERGECFLNAVHRRRDHGTPI